MIIPNIWETKKCSKPPTGLLWIIPSFPTFSMSKSFDEISSENSKHASQQVPASWEFFLKVRFYPPSISKKKK